LPAIDSSSGSGATDLTDVYAFAVGGNRSVFIANVNPGAGALPNSTIYFGSSVQYNITVDTKPIWYRVVLGPFPSIHSAQEVGARINKTLRFSPIVINQPHP